VRVKAIGRQPSPSGGRGLRNGGNVTCPATFRDAQLTLGGKAPCNRSLPRPLITASIRIPAD
jgi:hypothetical protein